MRLTGLSLFILMTAACSVLPNDEGRFFHLVSQWVQPGMTVDEATANLEKHGFKVGRSEPRSQQMHSLSFGPPRAFLYATRFGTAVPFVCSREWRLILPIEKETIAIVTPYIFEHCL